MIAKPNHNNVTVSLIVAVEGWIIIVTNIEKDMLEDDLFDSFSDFGEIKSINLNPDRRTG